MWIVRHGYRLLDVIHGFQLGDYIIVKTLALIAVNASQNAIDVEPCVDKDLGDVMCLLVVSNKDLTEGGEASVNTKIISLLSLDGATFKNWYTTGPEDYWQQAIPIVYVDMCIDPLQHGTGDNW